MTETTLATDFPTGATRLYIIVGDPIAQVKSPAGMTKSFLARDHNAVLVPVHVAPADLAQLIASVKRAKNLDGIIVTIPHKFAMTEHCTSLSPRAKFLGATNIIRRMPDGGWHGDMRRTEGQAGVARRCGRRRFCNCTRAGGCGCDVACDP
jgi:shikimate dehydrogenase